MWGFRGTFGLVGGGVLGGAFDPPKKNQVRKSGVCDFGFSFNLSSAFVHPGVVKLSIRVTFQVYFARGAAARQNRH